MSETNALFEQNKEKIQALLKAVVKSAFAEGIVSDPSATFQETGEVTVTFNTCNVPDASISSYATKTIKILSLVGVTVSSNTAGISIDGEKKFIYTIPATQIPALIEKANTYALAEELNRMLSSDITSHVVIYPDSEKIGSKVLSRIIEQGTIVVDTDPKDRDAVMALQATLLGLTKLVDHGPPAAEVIPGAIMLQDDDSLIFRIEQKNEKRSLSIPIIDNAIAQQMIGNLAAARSAALTGSHDHASPALGSRISHKAYGRRSDNDSTQVR